MVSKKPKKENIPIEHVRHSFAHVLAAAVLELYPRAKLGVGPVIEDGFFYDFILPKNLQPNDLDKIEQKMKAFIKQGHPFERQQLSAPEAKKLFKKFEQPFKVELVEDLSKYGTTSFEEIQKIKAGQIKAKASPNITLYKTGPFIDLCKGGHVMSTKELNPEAFKITSVSGAYWRADQHNPQMQRIYAVAFRNQKDLAEYLKQQEEAAKRDHRKIGTQLDLYSFQDVAPGAVFWHPKGMVIWNELEQFLRKKLIENGYQEVQTPLMVKPDVFAQSGHLSHYKENMFHVTGKDADEEFYLKPMNCPESTYIYKSSVRSYRDLPIRLMEIGRIHRNELSGTLGGLFRVRQITQDDGHIYLRPDQLQEEVTKILGLSKEIYSLFNLKTTFYLATRPDNAMGDPKLWTKAEAALEYALKKNKLDYDIKPKDGTFYAPKIDVHVQDSLGRDWQLCTIQADLVMIPDRFDITYTEKDGSKVRPVVIHRAIFGSFERFIGVIIEHFAGALPLWLAPIQVALINVAKAQVKTIEKFEQKLRQQGIRTWLLNQNETVGKKIRDAEVQKVPYMLVVGPKENSKNLVSVRSYKKGDLGTMKQEVFLQRALKEIENKTIN
ncbi:threonine--tRNA ligase [Candidatus Parcubacteria bacterium]|nr:MAG: threonine--tRNA ligase [Candidatus Parcubacteria bacterium]